MTSRNYPSFKNSNDHNTKHQSILNFRKFLKVNINCGIKSSFTRITFNFFKQIFIQPINIVMTTKFSIILQAVKKKLKYHHHNLQQLHHHNGK